MLVLKTNKTNKTNKTGEKHFLLISIEALHLNQPIRTYKEADYLLVALHASESTHAACTESSLLTRTLVNAIPGIIAGVAVIAIVVVGKFMAHRFIYVEEWSLAIVSLCLWGFGILFRRAFLKTVKLLAGTCLAVSLIACLSLIAVSFSDCFANGMAIRWLEQNGSTVYWSSLRSKDHGNHPMLAYFEPIDSFRSEVKAHFVPMRVFRSLNAQSIYWDLSQASQNLPRAIQAISQVPSQRKLKVFDIDRPCLTALAALPPFPPYPGFASLNLTVQRLSPETVDAILTSCILCDLTAVETTSDFNSLLRLVESPGVFSFHLENQSQFPIEKQRKLRK